MVRPYFPYGVKLTFTMETGQFYYKMRDINWLTLDSLSAPENILNNQTVRKKFYTNFL